VALLFQLQNVVRRCYQLSLEYLVRILELFVLLQELGNDILKLIDGYLLAITLRAHELDLLGQVAVLAHFKSLNPSLHAFILYLKLSNTVLEFPLMLLPIHIILLRLVVFTRNEDRWAGKWRFARTPVLAPFLIKEFFSNLRHNLVSSLLLSA
jgi:hypothetical protein